MNSNIWALRADIGHRSLDAIWGTSPPQLYNNVDPLTSPADNTTFNYWWLAHLIDVQIDGWARTNDASSLDRARETFTNIVERNGGSLFNDYFDDMLWLGLASLRLAEATGSRQYLEAALQIWDHCVSAGWNDTYGPSLAWRKQQLYYKNTPANGPLAILSMRLSRCVGDPKFAPMGRAAHAWIDSVMRDEVSGFVEDGINREGDGRIDTQWRFTYNQGLYIGSAVEQYLDTGDRRYIDRATVTAKTTLAELGATGVLIDDGDGGDEGLFKGVFLRYLGTLLPHLGSEDRDHFTHFVERAASQLWDTHYDGSALRATNDWRSIDDRPVYYSTQLSAIMALELLAVANQTGPPKR